VSYFNLSQLDIKLGYWKDTFKYDLDKRENENIEILISVSTK